LSESLRQGVKVNTADMNGTAPAALRFTVLVPLPNNRGQARAAVATWTREQTFGRGKFEVILLSDGSDPSLARDLNGILALPDRVLTFPGIHEFQMYNLAALTALGELLVITEGHCLADPAFLSEMDRFFNESPHYRAACGKSAAIAANAFARMDAYWVEHGFRQPWQPGNYPRVIRHGLAIDRRLFLAIGGFDPQAGFYAEQPLGAALCDRGHSVGSVPAALVRHHYRTGLLELWPFVKDMVRGEYACRRKYSADYLARYFGPATEPVRPDPQLSRTVCRLVGPELLRRLLRFDVRALWVLWLAMLSHVPAAIFGSWWHRLARTINVIWMWLACWRHYFSETRLRSAYQDLWQSMTGLARLDVPDLRSAPPLAGFHGSCRRLIDAWPADRLFGFHQSEMHATGSFRWSEPVFAIELPPRTAPFELELETGGLRSDCVKLVVFYNGRPLGSAVRVDDQSIRCRILPAPAARQSILFVCSPLRPRQHGVPDQRTLGIPVFAVSIRPCPEKGMSRFANAGRKPISTSACSGPIHRPWPTA
jgi:hypothetical protein